MQKLPKTYTPEITPSSFSLRDSDDHQNWVKSTFKYKGVENKKGLFEHQRIVRDYMQMKAPYRGILLYHGLGSGKTLSSIAISEIFVNEKDIVVMLPATLENNFKEEIYKFGNEAYAKQRYWYKSGGIWKSSDKKEANYGSLSRTDKSSVDKLINDLIDKRMTFIRYNGLTINRMEVILDEPKNLFDGKVVIVDEVHNFISRVANGSNVSKFLYKMIMDANDIKLVCLSGTPMINYAQEFALLINLLTGYVDKYTLRCMKRSFNIGLCSMFCTDPSVKTNVCDLSKNEVHVTLLPDKYEKMPDGTVKYNESIKHNIDDVVKRLEVSLKTNGIVYKRVMALPLKEKELLEKMQIMMNGKDNERNEVVKYFMDVTKGLVSYFYYSDPALFPRLDEIKLERIKMSDEQFASYRGARIVEYKQENEKDKSKKGIKTKINKNMFSNIGFEPSQKDFLYFKVYSRSVSNHILPRKKKDPEMLSRSSLKKFAPKIDRILTNLKKANGPVLVYSQYRMLAGLNIIADVLQNEGYSEVKVGKVGGELRLKTDVMAKKHFIVFSNTNKERMQVLMDVFNKNFSNLPKSVADDAKDINVDVILITQAGSEGISLKGVRQVHMLEPYWNYVRISQVIGRAARAKSHLHLPVEDQNVSVFIYLATMTEEQALAMEWDKGKLSKENMSSDEVIYDIAKRKEKMLGMLQTIMKETAMDCKVHLQKHLKIDPDMKRSY